MINPHPRYTTEWFEIDRLVRNAPRFTPPRLCPFCGGRSHARACQPLRALLIDDDELPSQPGPPWIPGDPEWTEEEAH